MAKTLYICYFGVREPLVQTQVLPYLRELGRDEALGLRLSLLTFEPKRERDDLAEFAAIKADLAAEGIEWHWLPYHKRPSALATAWDIFRGAMFIRRRIGQFDILHGRVHVPMLMGALARRLSHKKPKLLFDIRGFMPEEYTDAGIWPEGGLLYRGAKRVERWLMREADGFVVLTEKGREILFPESAEYGFDKFERPVEVIPCCIDAKRFGVSQNLGREKIRREIGIENRRVIVYVGSFGGWYMTDEIIDFFVHAHRQIENAFTLILTQRETEKVKANLISAGLNDVDFLVRGAAPAEVPKYLTASDIALSFIKACYSKQASSPTKIAEYLACGLPIISNSGVGDVDELIEQNGVGALVSEFTPEAYSAALEQVESLGDISAKCRETARRYFDLETVGGEKYRRIYRRLLT